MKFEQSFGNRDFLYALFTVLKNMPRTDDHYLRTTVKGIRSKIRQNTPICPYAGNGKIKIGNTCYYDTVIKSRYWPDSIKDAIQSGISGRLKSKSQYLYINGKYYDKDYCFFYDGQVYDKKEYFLSDNGPLSRKEYSELIEPYFITNNMGSVKQAFTKKPFKNTNEGCCWNKKDISFTFDCYPLRDSVVRSFLGYDGITYSFSYASSTSFKWEDFDNVEFRLNDDAKKAFRAIADRQEPLRTPSFTICFKGCNTKPKRFLRKLLENKRIPLQDMPKVIKVIKESLAL